MDLLTSSLLIISIASIVTAVLISNSRARKSSNLPPGPYRFPIIGNVLSLGPHPHRSLAKLSRKYGPVMSLKLGSITTVVVSSPETARVVLQKHDASCASRAVPCAAESLSHNEFSVAWLPAGAQWRKLRRICREQMFSVARLDASQSLRREKLQKLYEFVRESSEKGRDVDIADASFTTSMNLISASLFSMEFAQFDTESSHEMKDLIWGMMKCGGSPNLADFFPVLKFVDPQGILKETRFYFEKLLAIFDEIIEERMKSKGEKNDMLEALIDRSQRDEAELDKNGIIHLLMDLFVAGVDTTGGTVEWAMTELIRNPTKMSKLRNEVTNFTKENGELQESDIPRLPYLQSVVKETLRMHTTPFLLPRKAETDVEINGYIIPQNAQILVNAWASGRDPHIWTNPNEFIPERFLNQDNPIDFRGNDFELIPFGAGRRICPGLPLAYRMVHQMLVIFVAHFDWKIEGQPEHIDIKEKSGITLHKAVALRAVPMKA